MTLISSKICQYIRPDSVTNSDAEKYEYFLVWLGVDGGAYCWLFEDFIQKKNITGEVVNTKSQNITKLYQNASKSIELIAEDLSENEFDVYSNIIRAVFVERHFTKSSGKPPQKLAVLTNKIEKPKSQFRYDLQIEIEEVEDKIMR